MMAVERGIEMTQIQNSRFKEFFFRTLRYGEVTDRKRSQC